MKQSKSEVEDLIDKLKKEEITLKEIIKTLFNFAYYPHLIGKKPQVRRFFFKHGITPVLILQSLPSNRERVWIFVCAI